MNLELIIYGLIAFLIGLIVRVIESRKNAREKKDQKWGYTESKFVATGWLLLIAGLIMVILGFAGIS